MNLTPQAVAKAVNAPESVAAFQATVSRWYNAYIAKTPDVEFRTKIAHTKRKRLTLQMGARVCEDWSALLWGEESTVTAEGEREAALLEAVMGEQFRPRLNGHIEGTFALGTGVLEVIVEGMTVEGTDGFGGMPYVDTVEANQVYPLAWSKGQVTSIAIVNVSENICDIRIHEPYEGGQRIRNMRYRVWGSGLRPEPLPDGIAAEVEFPGAPPLFALWKPSIRNRLWPKGPYGCSALDRADSALYALDTAFDNFVADLDLGRKMVMVPETMLDTDANGNLIPPQSSNTQLFVSLNDTGFENMKPTEFNPALRVAENTEAIGQSLSLIGEAVGMGAQRYVFRDGSVQTATQVISENSQLFRTRRKHLGELTAALSRIARAVLWAGGLNADTDITVRVDDSIIADDATKLDEGIRLYQAGLISPKQFLVEYRHLTEEAAEAEASLLTVPDLFG